MSIERNQGPVIAKRGAGSGSVPDRTCSVGHSVDVTSTTGVELVLAMDSELVDRNGMHDTAINNSRITIDRAGVYALSFISQILANAVGVRKIIIRKNGVTDIAVSIYAPPGAALPELSLGSLNRLANGDYIEAIFFQNSGGNLDVDGSPGFSPTFQATLIA